MIKSILATSKEQELGKSSCRPVLESHVSRNESNITSEQHLRSIRADLDSEGTLENLEGMGTGVGSQGNGLVRGCRADADGGQGEVDIKGLGRGSKRLHNLVSGLGVEVLGTPAVGDEVRFASCTELVRAIVPNGIGGGSAVDSIATFFEVELGVDIEGLQLGNQTGVRAGGGRTVVCLGDVGSVGGIGEVGSEIEEEIPGTYILGFNAYTIFVSLFLEIVQEKLTQIHQEQ